MAATSDVRTRPSGRRSGHPDVVHFAPAAPARHRTQSVADSVLDSALHPGDAVLMLAGITAIVAIGIAAMVVSFGRRPGVSITGQMTE